MKTCAETTKQSLSEPWRDSMPWKAVQKKGWERGETRIYGFADFLSFVYLAGWC
jgi:hypothetical protein